MTEFQIGWSRQARRERLRALAWRTGVYAVASLWGWFGWYPLRHPLFGLHGWSAVIPWALLAGWDAVVIANRAFALVRVDDQGMEIRSFFTRRSLAWSQVSAIDVELRRVTGQRVLRVYRRNGYPFTVPGAVSPGIVDDSPGALPGGPRRYVGIADLDLDAKAEALRQQWHRVIEQPQGRAAR